ncbi:lactonase family protein [Microbacterium sp. ASV49]|uniref:Beta-propeller fold lactonase family protein n=1 Tax=Microbacterium candidum TaxID=3041922 RepID=A0ABT7MY72_9MICO|nr:beta-propeller fold lactonase family protein [Microbacterium sp. ASV49]MDL9979401.1 beta-propeller fold lactonase family protein [Microbacterium sp. ASV49]
MRLSLKASAAGVAALAAVATALLGGGAAQATTGSPAGSDPVGAVFVQTDGLAGNAIVAYDRNADGTLHWADTYPTGGLGLQLAGSAVDHLASQGSLARAGGSLFAVNAGSNTITSFAIRGDRLVRLQTTGSGGDAPVSIATHDRRVFVLNARGGGSIQGYLNVGGLLVKVPAWHRDLGLNPAATPQFVTTPGQIAFTPDGSKLIVTTKANTNAFDVFSTAGFGLSASPVVTTVPGTVPFGIQFDAAGHLVAVEAGPSAIATFTVNADGSLTQLAWAATGQAAACWVVVSGAYAYTSNAGSASLSGYRLGTVGSLTALGNTATDPGTVDAATAGGFLYVQTGATGTVDEFRMGADGSLTKVGSVLVPDAVGGEGIVAS